MRNQEVHILRLPGGIVRLRLGSRPRLRMPIGAVARCTSPTPPFLAPHTVVAAAQRPWFILVPDCVADVSVTLNQALFLTQWFVPSVPSSGVVVPKKHHDRPSARARPIRASVEAIVLSAPSVILQLHSLIGPDKGFRCLETG